MKTIILAAVAATLFSFTMPQESKAATKQNSYAVMPDKDVKYQEIKTSELPEAVTKTLADKYAGYKTEKAFKGDDGTFKVVVSKDEMKQVLFLNEKGEVTKVDAPDSVK
jgi:hypothetical protein